VRSVSPVLHMTSRKANGMAGQRTNQKTQDTAGMLNAGHAAQGGCSREDPGDFSYAAEAAQVSDGSRSADDTAVPLPKSLPGPARLPATHLQPAARQAADAWWAEYVAGREAGS
jgi:hypothetical protein